MALDDWRLARSADLQRATAEMVFTLLRQLWVEGDEERRFLVESAMNSAEDRLAEFGEKGAAHVVALMAGDITRRPG